MVSMCLKSDELKFLLEKWTRAGMSRKDACIRMDKLKIDLHNLVMKLKNKGKDEDYINKEFRRKFEIICQKADGLF